ncbi:hypothetical protein HN51_014027, partial [Arachis hypogaea]
SKHWRKLSAKRDLSIMYQTKLMATNIAYTLLGDGGKKKASMHSRISQEEEF